MNEHTLNQLRTLRLDGDATELGVAFSDIAQLAQQCRFRDCKHDREPGCALLKALEDGRLHPQRMASYRHILASLPEAEY